MNIFQIIYKHIWIESTWKLVLRMEINRPMSSIEKHWMWTRIRFSPSVHPDARCLFSFDNCHWKSFITSLNAIQLDLVLRETKQNIAKFASVAKIGSQTENVWWQGLLYARYCLQWLCKMSNSKSRRVWMLRMRRWNVIWTHE